MKRIRAIALLAIGVLLMVSLAACEDDKNGSQGQGQKTTEKYQKAASAAVKYPMAQMLRGDWLERRLLKENLLRQNDPNRLAYVTLLNKRGQPIVQYPINGMVFSLNSQMTTTHKTNNCNNGGTEGGCDTVTASPSDNGTWGPEPDGISFFTTAGVQVKWNGRYLESDAQQTIATKPILTYNVNGSPSVDAGGVRTK